MKDTATHAMKALLATLAPLVAMRQRLDDTPAGEQVHGTIQEMLEIGNRVVEIREHLVPKMEAGAEASIADLRMGVELHDLTEKFDVLLAKVKKLTAPDVECDCPPCTLRREIATKLGISVEDVEVKITIAGKEDDDRDIAAEVKDLITGIFSKSK